MDWWWLPCEKGQRGRCIFTTVSKQPMTGWKYIAVQVHRLLMVYLVRQAKDARVLTWLGLIVVGLFWCIIQWGGGNELERKGRRHQQANEACSSLKSGWPVTTTQTDTRMRMMWLEVHNGRWLVGWWSSTAAGVDGWWLIIMALKRVSVWYGHEGRRRGDLERFWLPSPF